MLYSTASFDDKLLPLIEKDAAFQAAVPKLLAAKKEKDAAFQGAADGIAFQMTTMLPLALFGYAGISALSVVLPPADAMLHLQSLLTITNPLPVTEVIDQLVGPAGFLFAYSAALSSAAYVARRYTSRKDFDQQVTVFQTQQAARNEELISLQNKITPTPTRSQILQMARRQADVLSVENEIAVVEKRAARAKRWEKASFTSYVVTSLPLIYSVFIHPFLNEAGQSLFPRGSTGANLFVFSNLALAGAGLFFGKIKTNLMHHMNLARQTLKGLQKSKAQTTAMIDLQNGPGQAVVLARALPPRTTAVAGPQQPVNAATCAPVVAPASVVAPAAAAQPAPDQANPRTSLWRRVTKRPASMFKK